jgi:hypothetical protein
MSESKILELAKKQFPQAPIIIEFFSTVVDHHSGIAKASQKPYEINKQTAYLHDPSAKYPKEFQVQLSSKEDHYPIGFYVLDIIKNLNFDNFGTLAVDSRSLDLSKIVEF